MHIPKGVNIYCRRMGETAEILALWRRAEIRGERVALATVVRVEGSSYRKSGARMLVTSGGERAGTISGGCLEAEVSRKIWWLTAQGPSIQQYQSSFDEDAGEIPWGLGCGGTVWLHLEQQPIAVLTALAAAHEQGSPSVVLFQLASPCAPAIPLVPGDASIKAELSEFSTEAFDKRQSIFVQNDCRPLFAEYLAPPPRLTVFGAGDDALPILEFAQALGWRSTVADGRAHLLQPGKFPRDTEVRLLAYTVPVACGPVFARGALPVPPETGVRDGELAVVLTHSYEQDRAILAALLPRDLLYLGILGPRHRTQRLLEEVAPTLDLSVEACFARLHSPVGLDLGARDPASIALSIVAGLQAALTGRRLTATRSSDEEPHPLVTRYA